ncbi:prepilin-type N-terminal cleavage/methylation domain-containing protein [Nostocaceae cyanobacterium CENA357]|uniref:Prepilin-type N-terminal cleavage/methylation domain-containing protein n=1 Tax=Atlanticothrix silvestris CENA357 TaxID=1725252 RepID=A0A8J7HLU3_9CYAN|nr:type IV pilin-like G/H family protein [Atlanticothrix silvestris]MBH8554590.1 prepilin-type N-terminal cleavage/methylation domain-containing protein [Atlanticothrix silvestris CENA357]
MLKPELQAKFLSHLSNRKNREEEGFTLIELLVVVIIIGVLAAIALPSLLGQVNKAKQAEPKNNVGTINRAQQAYFLEYQGFAKDMSTLQVGVKSQTDNFYYSVVTTADLGIVYASAYKKALKSYYGAVGTELGSGATSEALTVAIACESPDPKSVDNFGAVANVTVANITTAKATSCADSYNSLAR